MSQLRFDGRVAIVTGAGRGMGREYALLLAASGAKVVVNDLGGGKDGGGHSQVADQVVQEIVSNGGIATADYNSVTDGSKIIDAAIKFFGRVDILVCNAGIIKDISFDELTLEDWDLFNNVISRGNFILIKAAWPHLKAQKYGRIVCITSNSWMFGMKNQAHYCAAKAALHGLANTVAVEGQEYNITCTTVSPMAATRMAAGLLPDVLSNVLKPEKNAPLVAVLCHESNTTTGGLVETSGGWVGAYKWIRCSGTMESSTPESVKENWDKVMDTTNGTIITSLNELVAALIESVVPKK